MYSIQKRREISARIADPAEIPQYRRLLKASGNAYAGIVNPDERKLAVLLVSALLTTYSEEEIIQACAKPAEGPKTADTAAPSSSATAAVKKNARKLKNIRESTGKTWTTLWSGLRTLSSRMQSIWADGCVKLKSACTKKRRTPTS